MAKKFHLEQFSGRIGGFKELAFLLDKINEWEKSVLTDTENFRNVFEKNRDHFDFRDYRKRRKMIRTLSASQNRNKKFR